MQVTREVADVGTRDAGDGDLRRVDSVKKQVALKMHEHPMESGKVIYVPSLALSPGHT